MRKADQKNTLLVQDEETDAEDEGEAACSIHSSEDGYSDDSDGSVEDVGGTDDDGFPAVVSGADPSTSQVEEPIEDVDHDNMVSEAGTSPALDTLQHVVGDMLPPKGKRRRLLCRSDDRRDTSWDGFMSMGDGDWDGDSEDADWSPMGALELHFSWFCTNCTMPNSDEMSLCAKCGENRASGILSEGHLASSTASLQSLPAIAPENGFSRLFPVDSRECGKTVIGYDERMLLHNEAFMKHHPHPERPDRVKAILAGLAAEGLLPGRCATRQAREVTRSELEQVHSQEHVDAVESTCSTEFSYFTADTYANKDSSLAARLAAGICADLATAIVRGEAQNGFALVRPPGHHAERVTVMGFCLHNNAGVAAKAAQAGGAKKVLIVDWDVHHGNGTQDIFGEDPSVLYVSLHRHDGGKFYPGTGAASDVGSGEGEGSSVNIPWICGGIGDNDYIFAFLHIVLPVARQFSPDFTIISAGFDAAKGDPLGGCEVTPSGYAHMTSMLSSLSGGKILVILEGGYNLRSMSASASAVIKVLLGDGLGPLPTDLQPTEAGALSMVEVFSIQSKYWSCLQVPPLLEQIVRLAVSNSQKKGKHLRRRHYVGGPVWWKWGRRRVVYDLWCVGGARKHRWDSKHNVDILRYRSTRDFNSNFPYRSWWDRTE